MKKYRRSPGKISKFEMILLILFSLGYWIGAVFLDNYVKTEEIVIETYAIPLDLQDAIWPLAFFLWGTLTIILQAFFRSR